jgi:hypothetical protein
VTHLELRSDLARDLMTLRAPMPGLDGAGDSAFNGGFSLRLGELPTLVGKWSKAVAASPWQCPWMAELNQAYADAGAQASNPVVFAAAPVFNGVHLILTRFSMSAPGATPDAAGKLLIGSPNPSALAAMASNFVPELAQLKLKADGSVQPLPALKNVPSTLPAFAAMTDSLIGVSFGVGEESSLSDAMKTDPARQPLLVIGYSGRAFLEFFDQFADTTAMIEDPVQREEAERGIQMMRAMYGLIDRIEMRVEFDADGIAIHQSATMN